MPTFPSTTLKAFIMPQNNGKVVSTVLKRRAWWKIHKNQREYNFIWTPLLRKDFIAKLPLSNPEQKKSQISPFIYNRVEGNYNLSNKKDLYLNMKEYYDSTGEDLEAHIPLTHLIQGDAKVEAMNEFKAHFVYNKLHKRNNKWILKPGEYTNRGKGIKVSEKLSTIEKYVNTSKRK